MRLRIVGVGSRMPAWVDAGVADYTKRFSREFVVEFIEVKAASRTAGRTVEQQLDEEASRLTKACAGTSIIALDEHGSAWSTRDLASRLETWRDEAISISFAIGSADGLSNAFKTNAIARWSLSPSTLPHGLVRIVLVEQLYRATSILAGHPYHRE
ncbi:MAG TPA: 23S rRNA (pseudouridine(1915)-N(3))-methyltransferase RlmH [Casimicrobiaceae bacterium]|nr:23S rRNA (pseudouridine(1915)-N(3))-methyltransferase RlmH [Casimicrobiaceae bacterium]